MPKQLLLYSFIIFSVLKANGQNQNISNGFIFEGEPFIAVNPLNSQNIVVAWMGYVAADAPRLSIKIRTSFNGGLTWNSIIKMPHIVSTYKSADPSMAFDGNGKLFLSYIDYRESPDSGGVYLFKSTDGGLTWGAPLLMLDMYADSAKRPIDRPWLAVNNGGDKLYLTTKPAPWIAAPNRPYFVSSVDSGVSWQPWRFIDTTGFLVGNLIQQPMAALATSGNKIFAAYPSYVSSQNILLQFLLAYSGDAGNSFNYYSIQSGNSAANNDTAKLAYKLLADPSDTNHLVFIFPYSPFGDIDVMMTESFNAGAAWTAPIRVNDDAQGNGKMQDLIWADFDNDGDLIISWRDRRNAAGIGYTTASEFYAAFRDKDSANFAPNFLLSDSLVPYSAILAQSGNDFMGIELTNDTLSAVWANTRDGSLDVWFTRTVATTGQVASVFLLESESFALSVFPDPVTNQLTIDNAQLKIESIDVCDLFGKKIAHRLLQGEDKAVLDVSNLPAGIYFIAARDKKNNLVTGKFIKM